MSIGTRGRQSVTRHRSYRINRRSGDAVDLVRIRDRQLQSGWEKEAQRGLAVP